MQEKLVEYWLTSANELTYQIPFCEVLVARGYDVLHVSAHGRGEHGKDVIARNPKGRLCTFQLKGGDISLSDWRNIRGEIEELVELPVRIPGVSEGERHVPYLVTNGEIRGDALESIVRYQKVWRRRGCGRLRIISRRTLLHLFLRANARFLPTALAEFREFVELFVADFHDRVPREKLATLLEKVAPTADSARSETKVTRALAGVAVVAGYIAEQYERADNYVSAAEAWTVAAATILHLAERDGLAASAYAGVLRLLGLAVDRNLDALVNEALTRDDLTEGTFGIADPIVYGARVSLTFGWLAVAAHRRALAGQRAPDATAVRRLLRREFSGLRFAGEVDWPSVLLLSLYVEHLDGSPAAEALLQLWVRGILAANREGRHGAPSPYWLHERVIALLNGLLAPSDEEDFRGHTCTVPSAMDMLVRRLRRQLVAQLWPSVSRLHWCDFRPDTSADYFRWHAPFGTLRNGAPEITAHWSDWRASSAEVREEDIPALLRRHPEWLPPFLLTYPHRANRTLSAFADAVLGKRVLITSARADVPVDRERSSDYQSDINARVRPRRGPRQRNRPPTSDT